VGDRPNVALAIVIETAFNVEGFLEADVNTIGYRAGRTLTTYLETVTD